MYNSIGLSFLTSSLPQEPPLCPQGSQTAQWIFNLSYSTVATLESTLWPLKYTSQLRDKAQAANMNFQLLAPQCSTENERIRLTFEEECRGHYGEKREDLSGSYCNISVWGCFSLKKALVGGGPRLRASLTCLNTTSLLCWAFTHAVPWTTC